MELEPKWITLLSRLPESGMGYQTVRVVLRGGRVIEHLTVFNAEVLEIPENVRPFDPSEIVAIELERRS